MPGLEAHIWRILSEVQEPIYPSEIAERLNKEVGPTGAYTTVEVVKSLQSLGDRVTQLPDGGWTKSHLPGLKSSQG